MSAVMADHTKKKKNCTTAQRDTRAHRAHKRPPTRTAVAQQSATHAQHKTHAITEHEGKVHGHERLQRRLREPMISSSAADARPINCKSNVVPLAITRTNGPWTHTSDDSYNIYQLSLVLATATISYIAFIHFGSILAHSSQILGYLFGDRPYMTWFQCRQIYTYIYIFFFSTVFDSLSLDDHDHVLFVSNSTYFKS